jgi:hypothetical protein
MFPETSSNIRCVKRRRVRTVSTTDGIFKSRNIVNCIVNRGFIGHSSCQVELSESGRSFVQSVPSVVYLSVNVEHHSVDLGPIGLSSNVKNRTLERN